LITLGGIRQSISMSGLKIRSKIFVKKNYGAKTIILYDETSFSKIVPINVCSVVNCNKLNCTLWP